MVLEVIIRLEARLQPNIGFTLRRVLTFFRIPAGRHNSAMITDRRKFTTK